MLIPLEKLYRQNTGDSLAISLAAFSEPAERIRFLADQLEKHDGNSELRRIFDRYAGN